MPASSARLIYEFEKLWETAARDHLRSILVPASLPDNGHIITRREVTELDAPWVTCKYAHGGQMTEDVNLVNSGLLALPAYFHGVLSVMIQTHRVSGETLHDDLCGRVRFMLADWSRTIAPGLAYWDIRRGIEQSTQQGLDMERMLDSTTISEEFEWIILPGSYPGTV